jgi:hypothetical protein
VFVGYSFARTASVKSVSCHMVAKTLPSENGSMGNQVKNFELVGSSFLEAYQHPISPHK